MKKLLLLSVALLTVVGLEAAASGEYGPVTRADLYALDRKIHEGDFNLTKTLQGMQGVETLLMGKIFKLEGRVDDLERAR